MSRRLAGPTVVVAEYTIEDSAYRRIKQIVWQALYRWEQTGAAGSARPIFERAWTNGLHLEGIPATPQVTIVRDKLYQHWLREGPPLTATSQEDILRTRPRARAIFDGLGIGVVVTTTTTRDPGQEG